MKILQNHLYDKAKDFGFPIVGVIEPHYFKGLKERLTGYIKEGYTLEFNNKGIEEKCNPFLAMESCKTIVVLGIPYYSKHKETEDEGHPGRKFRGRLARVAWGEDYHRVFHRKMKELADELRRMYPGLSYQAYVDTGPLVDRYLASKAGLGFYGYNNLFYHREFGSYVFYGYMLLDYPLKGVLEKRNREDSGSICQDCRKCIKACPGKAIEKPYRLNASRCISGILQKKGMLSDEEKSIVGNRIYGCDVCQQVCPYNKEIKLYSEPAFIPENVTTRPDLIELLQLSNREFKEIYGKNASAWRGARVLKRNALVALGNYEDHAASPYIHPFSKDTREDLRDAAQWALAKIHGGDVE